MGVLDGNGGRMKPSRSMGHSTPVEGRTIGRYRVQKHVASGGMAEIYLATYDDRGESREAVVKVILRERAQDRKFVQMFLDEARVTSTFIHPNIAQLFEVGRDQDTYFYAMEYVHGDNVRALIERSLRARVYMPLAVTLTIGIRTAAALHYAHERASSTGELLNAVHRDVTPSNIMLGFDGSVKLLDFGIARADSRAQMTQSGTVKGKFAYMSPEQCKGQHVDRRTDVFALGIVLYELSTQRRAFRAESDFGSMDRIIRGDLILPHLIHPDYPRSLENILLKALATDPEQRYQTAAELGAALTAFAQVSGVAADDAVVAGVMSQLFHAEAPARPPAAASAPVLPSGRTSSPPAPMSLASMLAATAEQMQSHAAQGMDTMTSAPAMGTPSAQMMAVPAPVKAPTIMGVPAPVRGRRPSTELRAAQSPALYPPAPAPAAIGTPPSMTRVVPDEDAVAGFARSSDSMPVIELDDARVEELTSSALIEMTSESQPLAPGQPAIAHALPTPAPAAYTPHPYAPVTPGSWPAPEIAMGSGQIPVPGPQAWPQRPSGAAPAVLDPEAHEKSRLGLWMALAAILAVGAVVAALMVASSLGIF
jgi:serine/threonine protein kinase